MHPQFADGDRIILRVGGAGVHLDMGDPLDLGPRLWIHGKKKVPRWCRDVGAIIHPISAPKMERAPIFQHVASGILKKASLEAEKFEKW